jgi:hypothetical protein
MIGFISTSITISLNHTDYSATGDLHNLQITVAHALGFPVFTSRLLATDLNTETSPSKYYEVFLLFRLKHSVLLCPNLYSINLPNSLRTRFILLLVFSTAESSWILLSCKRTSVIYPRHGQRRKQFYCCVAQTT